MNLKKIVIELWSARWQFAKYFIVGITTVLLDIASLVLLKEKAHMEPVWAVVLNQFVIIAYNFSLNKYWSFKSGKFSKTETLRYLSLTCFNYFFSIASMYVFNTRLHFNYLLVRIVSIAAVVAWNFLLYKYWVYVQKEEDLTDHSNGI